MIIPFGSATPRIPKNTFIAGNASVIGDVSVGERSGIWFGAVIRGDLCSVSIGDETSIQDNCVIHAEPGERVIIGNWVTVGHGAVVHGCTIKDNVLIGMNATILNGAEVGEDSIVGAGALVTQGKRFPPRSMILGVPAKVVRELTDEEIESIRRAAGEYVRLREKYLHLGP